MWERMRAGPFEELRVREGRAARGERRLSRPEDVLPAELGGETAAAAMNLLANTDAIIIDVRKNGGGGRAWSP